MRLYMDDAVFLDSSFFKALIDPKDEFHKKASKTLLAFKNKKTLLTTSNYILDETFTLIRARCGRVRLKELRNFLNESESEIKVFRVSLADEADAWNWILEDWSNLSFTDCVSFAQMKRLGIKRAAAFDNHFVRAGFALV